VVIGASRVSAASGNTDSAGGCDGNATGSGMGSLARSEARGTGAVAAGMTGAVFGGAPARAIVLTSTAGGRVRCRLTSMRWKSTGSSPPGRPTGVLRWSSLARCFISDILVPASLFRRARWAAFGKLEAGAITRPCAASAAHPLSEGVVAILKIGLTLRARDRFKRKNLFESLPKLPERGRWLAGLAYCGKSGCLG
jgi:hypothetical protein